MASSHMNALSRAMLAITATVAIPSSVAFAAQGPGGSMGTASQFTQTAMAVLVYGIVAIVVCAGLIAGVRKR